MWWTGAPSVSRPPTHVTAGTCHPQLQPILLDYTFCILCDIVDSQIRYSEGPRSLQDRLSPQNSRPRTLVPGRRGQRRPFTTARLSQGHARTENVQNSVSSTLPPRRPAPPVQSSSSQPRLHPNPPITRPTCQARCSSMTMSIYIYSGR